MVIDTPRRPMVIRRDGDGISNGDNNPANGNQTETGNPPATGSKPRIKITRPEPNVPQPQTGTEQPRVIHIVPKQNGQTLAPTPIQPTGGNSQPEQTQTAGNAQPTGGGNLQQQVQQDEQHLQNLNNIHANLVQAIQDTKNLVTEQEEEKRRVDVQLEKLTFDLEQDQRTLEQKKQQRDRLREQVQQTDDEILRLMQQTRERAEKLADQCKTTQDDIAADNRDMQEMSNSEFVSFIEVQELEQRYAELQIQLDRLTDDLRRIIIQAGTQGDERNKELNLDKKAGGNQE